MSHTIPTPTTKSNLGPTIVNAAPKVPPSPGGNFPSGGSKHLKPATVVKVGTFGPNAIKG